MLQTRGFRLDVLGFRLDLLGPVLKVWGLGFRL